MQSFGTLEFKLKKFNHFVTFKDIDVTKAAQAGATWNCCGSGCGCIA